MSQYIEKEQLLNALLEIATTARMHDYTCYDSVQSAKLQAKAELCEELIKELEK